MNKFFLALALTFSFTLSANARALEVVSEEIYQNESTKMVAICNKYVEKNAYFFTNKTTMFQKCFANSIIGISTTIYNRNTRVLNSVRHQLTNTKDAETITELTYYSDVLIANRNLLQSIITNLDYEVYKTPEEKHIVSKHILNCLATIKAVERFGNFR